MDTPPETPDSSEPSELLLNLVHFAISDGLEIFKKEPHLVQMAILSTGGEYSLLAFDRVSDEIVATRLRQKLSSPESRPEAYVLRYRGELVKGDDELVDAVVVEGATPEMSSAWQWAYPLGPEQSVGIISLGPRNSYYAPVA